MAGRSKKKTYIRDFVFGVVAILVVGALLCAHTNGFERLRFEMFPTAARGYELGTRHLDARHKVNEYDLKKASYYFDRASALEPRYPNLQHQRARVAFLRGELITALGLINTEIAAGPKNPSSYYVRGLIEGYLGMYAEAAHDYESYLRTDPHNWAAINDYAWVLMKDAQYDEALIALDWGLIDWPNNAWLLNSKATALYELGRVEDALSAEQAASQAVATITEKEWMRAYPGNDPLIATDGVAALKRAIDQNMHSITTKAKSVQKDVP